VAASPGGAANATSLEAGGDDAEDSSTSLSVSRRSRSEHSKPLVSARLIGGVGTRTYQLKASDLRFEYRTRRPYPEAGLLIEAQPLRDMGRYAQGFGLEVQLVRGFVTSALEPTEGTATDPVATPVTRLHLDARYGLQVLKGRFGPTLSARVGWAKSSFDLSKPSDLFTGVAHTGIRFGLEAVQPVVPGFADVQLWAFTMPGAQAGAAEIQRSRQARCGQWLRRAPGLARHQGR
jgi:hypothetical protein